MARAAKAIKDTADAAAEAGAETRKAARATGETALKATEDTVAAANDAGERTVDAMSAAASSVLPDNLQGVTEPAAAAASAMMSAAATLPRGAAEMMPAIAGAGPRMAMPVTAPWMQATTPWAMGPWAAMPAMMALSLHAMAAATAFWTWPLSGAAVPSAGRPRS